jgi:hypothetical protein
MFKVGDKVYCDSGHTGYDGHIVAIVPPHIPPGPIAEKLPHAYCYETFFGKPRKRESYLVEVLSCTKDGLHLKRALRWPKVDRLRVKA